jgi:hypothetical protein
MITSFLFSLATFAVIEFRWPATRTRLAAQGALDALNASRFALRSQLPSCLIAGRPLRQSLNRRFYTGYLVSGAIIFVWVLGASRIVAARGLSTAGASGSRQ